MGQLGPQTSRTVYEYNFASNQIKLTNVIKINIHSDNKNNLSLSCELKLINYMIRSIPRICIV